MRLKNQIQHLRHKDMTAILKEDLNLNKLPEIYLFASGFNTQCTFGTKLACACEPANCEPLVRWFDGVIKLAQQRILWVLNTHKIDTFNDDTQS